MKRRGLAVLLAAVLGASMLAGCGNSEDGSSGGKKKVRLMVWSPSEDQSKDSGEWLQTTCEKFADEHPEWDITFVYGVADEATAAGQVAQDPEASADVFMYANDTLTTMTDANALVKFGGKYREEIERTNTEEVISSLTKNGELYGVPFTTNTWFMYYDKSVFDEEDVKNLDTMLEKGVVSFPMTNLHSELSTDVCEYLVHRGVFLYSFHILCAGGILLPFQAKIQVAEALYEHGDDPGTVSRIHVHGCRLLYLKGNRTDRRESDQSGADFVLFRRRGAWIPDRERIL